MNLSTNYVTQVDEEILDLNALSLVRNVSALLSGVCLLASTFLVADAQGWRLAVSIILFICALFIGSLSLSFHRDQKRIRDAQIERLRKFEIAIIRLNDSRQQHGPSTHG